MAVKIRLKRMGSNKNPKYRVVVADARFPRDGRIIETVGTYDPIPTPPVVKINEPRALYWLSQGAQPTDKVASLLRGVGLMKKFREATPASAVE